jgi:hypothetical protein
MELSTTREATRCYGHSIVSQHFMEPEGQYRIHKSSPPVPILSKTNPVHITHPTSPRSILILSIHLRLGLPSGSFPLAFPPIIYKRSSSPHSCYMVRPSHPPRLNYSNYTWRRVQITKFLVIQFSPFSRHIIPLRSKRDEVTGEWRNQY